MTRISTTFPKIHIPKIDTCTVSFVYDDGFGRVWDVTCEVEVDAPESYTCTNVIGADEVNDHLYRCICEKAEELVSEREQQLRNAAGCECPPVGDGTLAQMIHEDTCPIRLSKAERKIYEEQRWKDTRGLSDR
jgi:hypothetical protein